MVGTGIGAQHGILFKNGNAIENGFKVNAICFDKTGTLTHGELSVVQVDPVDPSVVDARELALIAACGEQGSEHPVAHAIIDYAKATHNAEATRGFDGTDFEVVPGKGIKCKLTGDMGVRHHACVIGNRAWMQDNDIALPATVQALMERSEAMGYTTVLVADETKVLGTIALTDQLKDEATSVVNALENMGIEVWMVTGDEKRNADVIAAQCGITRVAANVLPAGKSARVAALQQKGYTVAMVGDGINDSLGLAQADLGIAVANGTEVAMEMADVVLMKNSLEDVLVTLDISQKTFNRIKLNFFWAFAYNVVLVPVAAGIFYPLLRPYQFPAFLASVAMAFSSVSVVLSSLSLKFYRKPNLNLGKTRTAPSSPKYKAPSRSAAVEATSTKVGEPKKSCCKPKTATAKPPCCKPKEGKGEMEPRPASAKTKTQGGACCQGSTKMTPAQAKATPAHATAPSEVKSCCSLTSSAPPPTANAANIDTSSIDFDDL